MRERVCAVRAGGQPAASSQRHSFPSCAGCSLLLSLPSGTDTFSPVAFSLGLLLVMATAFPTPVPREEDSKDDTASNRPPLTSSEQIEKLIKSILLEISDMKNKVGKLNGG